jgi:RNA polymerase sigma-70 factor (ECF subfamily)
VSIATVTAFRNDSSDGPAESELIARTLSGDGGAYAILVERFQRRIYRVVRAIVRDDAEADGITQDTFVQAYTNLAKFEGRSGLETWLTRIAINRSRDSLRRRRFVSLFTSREDGEGDLPIIEPVDERPDPERQLLSVQLRKAIQRAERQLSAQQQTIFRLRHYENLALEEIAEHLGLQPGTVRVHLFRAVHKIRNELAEWRSGRASEE